MFWSSGFSLFSLPLHTDKQINKSLHVRQISWFLKILFHILQITDLEKIFLITSPVWNVFHLKCCPEKFSVPRQYVTSYLIDELTLVWKNQYKHKSLVQSLRSPLWEVTFLTRQVLEKGIFFHLSHKFHLSAPPHYKVWEDFWHMLNIHFTKN